MENTETQTAQTRYSKGAMLLHWLIAFAIIANWLIAQIAEDAPEAKHDALMGTHVALGMSVLILTVVRIIWRLTHKRPAPNPDHAPWERMLASVAHKLLYFLMIALPLTGYLMVQNGFGGMDINMFGLFDFPGIAIAKDKNAAEIFAETHEIFAIAMLALFILHVAGAWKHQLLDRDGTIFRMLPFGKTKG